MRLPFGRKYPDAEFDRAREHRQRALLLAAEVLGPVEDAMFFEATRDAEFASFVADGGKNLILAIEMNFLWGLFGAHTATEEFPTPWLDRTHVLLIEWLVEARGMSPDAARGEAAAVRSAFNSGNQIHDVISELGRRAYTERDLNVLVKILRWRMGALDPK